MRVYHSDRFQVPLPPAHRFPMQKYAQLRQALITSRALSPSELEEATPIEREALALVHSAQYLDAVFSGGLNEAQQRQLGFPWSEELVLRSRASVGGTLAAARSALEHGIGGNLAGGTHHSFADRGEGYCVFNDIAVAVRVLQREKAIRRAVIVDLDVHQGNGTASIFAGDQTVFTFSMHGEHNFPFRKARSSRDVGLPDDTGDQAYLEAVSRHLPEVLEAADADILFYQAGVDPLAEDALGRLSLSCAGLRERDRLVLEAARRRKLPSVLTLGGGYARPIELSVAAHLGTYLAALETRP